MMKSKFKKHTEMYILVTFQLFLIVVGIIKSFKTNDQSERVLAIASILLVLTISLLLISNLFKSIEIVDNKIIIKKLFFLNIFTLRRK